MNNLHQELQHLIALTQLYIQKEVDSPTLWIAPEAYPFYKNCKPQQKNSQPQKTHPRPPSTTHQPKITPSPIAAKLSSTPPPQPTIKEPLKSATIQNNPQPFSSKENSQGFILEQLKEPTLQEFSEVRKLMQERFPRLALQPIPTNEQLFSVAGKHVLIVHTEKTPETLNLLTNIAKALCVHGTPTVLIRLAEYIPLQLPEELKLLISTPETAENCLSKAPTLTLHPLAEYLNKPELKRELWNQLQQRLLS